MYWERSINNESIYNLIENRRNLTPNANAIVAPGHSPLTYSKLSEQVHYVISFLNSIGIGRNDCVATVLSNGPDMAVAFISIASCATVAPLNPAYSVKEFDRYFSLLKPKAIVLASGQTAQARLAAQARNITIIDVFFEQEKEAGAFKLVGGKRAKPKYKGFSKAEDTALILHTSGTTSQPKQVPLTQMNLLTSAHNVRSSLNLVASDRALNIMPLFHIHGIIASLLSSLVSGGSIVCVPDFNATEFFQWVKTFKPTWYTAVPTMHQSILDRADKCYEIVESCQLRFIRSSSSALPSSVLMALESTFKVPVIEAYGMTEATHQIASNPLPPEVRKTGSVGLAGGPQVKIMSESEPIILPKNSIGEIIISGSNVTSGYLGNPEANHHSFVDSWFRTGDLGYIDADGYLFITGRIKEMINRGGEKIAPVEVDEVLLAYPPIAQAVTFAIPHSRLGEEVAAVVVLHEDAETTKKEIQEFVAARLGLFKVPKHIVITDEIPKSATGKTQRIGLAEKLGLSKIDIVVDLTDQKYSPPCTDIEKQLVDIWVNVLKIPYNDISITYNFFQLGGDSILVARTIAQIQENFAIVVSFLDFFNAPTVAELSDLILAGDSKQPDDKLLLELLSELDGLTDEQVQQLIDKKQ